MKPLRSWRIASAAVLVGLAGLVPAAPAAAQYYIGQMVGEMAAEQARIAAENACRAGASSSPRLSENIRKDMDKLIKGYADLTSSSKPADIKKVFATKTDGLSWRDWDGTKPVDQLKERLDAPASGLTLVSSIVAGDGLTARGVWTQAAAGGGPVVTYAVDFTAEGFSSWRIWHMTVTRDPASIEMPASYCHFLGEPPY